jgi:hypothetical protein
MNRRQRMGLMFVGSWSLATAITCLIQTPARAQEVDPGVDIGSAVACKRTDAAVVCTERPDVLEDAFAAADEAGVDASDVVGAINSLEAAGIHTDPRAYLISEGLLAPPQPTCGLPICGPLGQRIWCIEGYESRHFGGAVNRWTGAAGYLQWLPSTAREWRVSVGNRWSEWMAAASIASLGERFFRSQWVPIQRGLC